MSACNMLAYVFTGEYQQSEWMKRNNSNRVNWFEEIFLSLVDLQDVLNVKVQL